MNYRKSQSKLSTKQRFVRYGLLILGLVAFLAVLIWPTEARQAEDDVGRIWHNVQRAGSYGFTADITQNSIPAASVLNIGRAGERHEIRLEGTTRLNEQFLDMTLWSQGGSVLDPASGLQIKLENGRMQARQGVQEWQEIQDFSAGIMPQGDFLTFLAGAKEITNAGEETRNGITFTRYTYQIDGPAFAEHTRAQFEQQLQRDGSLPPQVQLQLPENLSNMSGTGELWVDSDGLPLRLLATLNYPEEGGLESLANIKVTFTEFGARPTFLQQAFSDLPGLLTAVQPYLLYGVAAGLAGAFLFFVLRRTHLRVIYNVVAVLCIGSMLFSPLLQTAHAQSSHEKFQAYQDRQQALQEEAEAYETAMEHQANQWQTDLAQTGPAALAEIRNDSGLDSDADGLTDVQEQFLGSDPYSVIGNQYSVNSGQLLTTSNQPLATSDQSPISNPQSLSANENLLQISSEDSDGDGLTDYEEELLGTAADNPDTDGDTLTDLQEIEGFTLGGVQWYTNPREIDTNMDGVGDAAEWNDGDLHATWDLDGDNVPDLFDRDNDGDGVPDKLDISPFNWFENTTFTSDNPFELVLEGLTPDVPTFVEFQLRPTNPDHLWYALNPIDWPTDMAGNIQDRNGSLNDVELTPMLEISIPDRPTNLPVTDQQVTFDIDPFISEAAREEGHLDPISGVITLTHTVSNTVHVAADLDDSLGTSSHVYELRRGTCGKTDPLQFLFSFEDDPAFTAISFPEMLNGEYVITISRVTNPQLEPNEYFGCAQIPQVPFEGDKLLDIWQLQPYGISVRNGFGRGVERFAYVPLTLVVDDPAGLDDDPNLTPSDAPRGGRVAFSGLMPYEGSGIWNNAHEVRLVWTVNMKNDVACPEDAMPNCTGFYDVPTIIHTYDDEWVLTGLDVREENGVELAVAYEDPTVDTDFYDDTALVPLASGLGQTWMASRETDGVRDFSVPEIERRFNHATNGSVPLEERWGIDNSLTVITRTYPTLYRMGKETVDLSQEILAAEFESVWSTAQPISPTLLFASEWNYRVLNLDAQPHHTALDWNATARQLTLKFNTDATPLLTNGSLKLQPYRYDGTEWENYAMVDYWAELAQRYEADIAADPDPNAEGKLALTQLFYYTLNNGVQQTIKVGDQPTLLEAAADSEVTTINLQVGAGATVPRWLFSALLKPAIKGTRADTVLEYLKVTIIDGQFKDATDDILTNSIKRMAATSPTAANSLLIGSVLTTGVLVAGQLALGTAFRFVPPEATSGVKIALSVITIVTTIWSDVISPIKAALNTKHIAGETLKVLGLTSKLSSVKATGMMNIIGLIIDLTILWGVFGHQAINGGLTAVEYGAAESFASAATIVALIYFSIASIPVVGPIIVAILGIIDAFLTLLCEAGVTALRGIVTEGSDTCFSLAGALTEVLGSAFYTTGIIFDFESNEVAAEDRFPQFKDFTLTYADPAAGLIVGNTLTFSGNVGGWLAPSDPDTFSPNVYTPGVIRSTGLAAELSPVPDPFGGVDVDNLVNAPWNIQLLKNVSRYTQFHPASILFGQTSSRKSFPIYIAQVPDLAVGTKPIILTQSGINADYMGPLHLNIAMLLPVYTCKYGVCEIAEHDYQGFTNPAFQAPEFSFDILPATIDDFFARDWGQFTVDGETRGIPFDLNPANVDFDGDRLLDYGPNFNSISDPDTQDHDFDNDGLPDGYETELRRLGTDALNTSNDTDGDGLCDALELELKTDPGKVDTDFDGLDDGEEVWHPDCSSGTWSGGWQFTYDVANGLTTRVTSDPLNPDSDFDGLSDLAERQLHQLDPALFDYHPTVQNDVPVAFSFEFDDADSIVASGSTFTYFSTVSNDLQAGLYANGTLTSNFPTGLGGSSETNSFNLFQNQQQTFTTTLTASGPTEFVLIGNDISAELLESAQATPGGAPTIAYSTNAPLQIDNDLPTSIIASSLYVQAGGLRTIGGEASDPTSYIQQVEVQVPGQTTWEVATGKEAWAYNWAVPTAEGRYTVESRATDAVDFVENPVNSTEFIVDGTPPTVTTNQSGNPILPASRDATFRWTIPLDGTVTDPAIGSDAGSGPAQVEVLIEPLSNEWQPATLNGNSWSIDYSLARYDDNGAVVVDATDQYTVTLRATDQVNNLTAVPDYFVFNVRVDNTPPTASLDSLSTRVDLGDELLITDTLFITRTAVLTGTISDPGGFASGVDNLEIAFTPIEALDALEDPTLLYFLNDPVGLESYQDGSGNGNHAQCSGATCPVNDGEGQYGGAPSFDGVDDHIAATVDIAEGDITLSLWFNSSDGNGGLFSAVSGTLGSGGADRSLYLVNGNVCAFVQGVIDDEICTAGANYADGQWHQAVLVLDSSAPFRLYVDGTLGAAAGSVTASTLTTQDGITLGFSQDIGGNDRYLNGQIDEVELYTAPLSAEIVDALFTRWQLATLAASGPGVTETTWSFPVPDGIEGVFQIDIRAEDVVGNRNDEERGKWQQWQGIIDSAPPTINYDINFSGNDSTAQTDYTITIKDFNLTTDDYTGECDIATAQYTYDESPFWLEISNNAPRLTRLDLNCSANGHIYGWDGATGQIVDYAATACDIYGHCSYQTANRHVIYWSTLDGNIYRQNINAVHQLETLSSGLPAVTGLDVDADRGHLYWLELGDSAGAIYRSDLDGSNAITIPVSPPPPPRPLSIFPISYDLVVNPLGGKMYWSEEDSIRWANLDGSAAATLFTLNPGPNDLDRIGRLEIDLTTGQLYFAVNSTTVLGLNNAQIWVMGADGSNPQILVDAADLNDVFITDLSINNEENRLYWLQRDQSGGGGGVTGLFSLDLNGGIPVFDSFQTHGPYGILEISPGGSFAYVSDLNLINKVNLADGSEGTIAGALSDHVIASAIAKVPGFSATVSDLELTKRTVATGVATVGGTLDYELLAHNNGPVAATEVTVVDTLPANTTFVSAGSSPECSETAPGIVTCNIDTLVNNETRNLIIQVQIEAGASGNLVNNASIASEAEDPNSLNNDVTYSDAIAAAAPTATPSATGRYLYWTSRIPNHLNLADRIVRYSLDTGAVEVVALLPNINLINPDITADAINGKIYWTSRSDAPLAYLIQRANLDGSNVETVYTTDINIDAIQLDAVNGHIYFVKDLGQEILRINTDGSGEATIISSTAELNDLVINPVRGEIYWSEDTSRFYRANLDGSGQTEIDPDLFIWTSELAVDPYADMIYIRRDIDSINRVQRDGRGFVTFDLPTDPLAGDLPFNPQSGPALDIPAGKLYWVGETRSIQSGLRVTDALLRADLNGSNMETLVSNLGVNFPESNLVLVYTNAPLPTATPTNTPPPPTGTPTPLPTPTPGGPLPAENLYWSSEGGEVLHAPVAGCLDGSCVQTIVTPSPGTSAGDLDIDSVRGHVYWVNPVDNSIQRSDLDGANPQTLVTGLTDPSGIVIDEINQHIYWTDYTDGTIQRSGLDGSLVTTIISGLTEPLYIDIDHNNQHLYFIESNQDINLPDPTIRRVDLDGSNLVAIYTHLFVQNDPTFIVSGIAVDQEMGRVYYSIYDPVDFSYRTEIYWVNFDGTGATLIALEDTDVGFLWDSLAYDRNAFRLYFGGPRTFNEMPVDNVIQSAPPDGTISGGTIITTTANLSDRPISLAMQYPLPTPVPCLPDAFESDDDFGNASTVTVDQLNSPHYFHNSSDEDWYAFDLEAGFTYDFQTQGNSPEVDTVLELYDTDGTTLLDSNDDMDINNPDSFISYTPFVGGTYYARVTNKSQPAVDICDSSYTFRADTHISEPLPPLIDPQPAEVVPLVIDSTVLTPTDQSLITAPGPVTISGAAFSNAAPISEVSVMVDGVVVDTAVPGSDDIWTSTAWSPATESLYTLESTTTDTSGNVQTMTHPITVSVDFAPPAITIDQTVFTQTHIVGEAQVALSGTATDSNGINLVELQFEDGPFQGANLTGTTWTLPWFYAVDPDGGTVAANIRATDKAGRSTTINETLLIDIIPPQIGLITTTHQSAITPTVIFAGDTVSEANPTLALTWPAATDGSGVAAYYAGFSTSLATPALSALTQYGGAATHSQVLGEAQIVYAHLVVVDGFGNQTTLVEGPYFVDGPAAPSLISDPDNPGQALFGYLGWLESGSQLGTDRAISRGPLAGSPVGVPQEFYLTWDDSALRMAWIGGNWNVDGDLFIYLDTAAGGATQLYDPTSSGTTIGLPTGMTADYVIWVQDDQTAVLLDSNFSPVTTLTSDNFRHETGMLPLLTDIYLPFSLLGISNASSLGVVAVASEDTALRLWASAPDKNPLNSERVINPSAVGRDLSSFDLTLFHQWSDLSLGQTPNDGRFANSDLQITINSSIDSLSAGFLSDDLLDLLVPGIPIDADEDGNPDGNWPGSIDPATVGSGQVLSYNIYYINNGPITATNVTVNLIGSTALDVSANPTINLGDIAPGASGTADFTAVVTGASVASAELRATVSDGPHGAYDYFWFQNDVDANAPTDLQIIEPVAYARPFSQTVAGTVQDAASVPDLTVRVELLPGGTTFDTTCTDATPTDSLWACQVDFGDLSGSTSVNISVQATDEHGNQSGFSTPVNLLVDLTAPTVSLDAATEAALADGFISLDEGMFDGTVDDDQEASSVKICTEIDTDLFNCEIREVMPGGTPSGDWVLDLDITAADGLTQTMTFAGIDAAGNISAPITRTFQIDTVGPVITATQHIAEAEAPLSGVTVLSGSVNDGGGVDSVHVRVEAPDSSVTFEQLTLVGADWTYAPTLTAVGTYTLTVEAYDLAGNGSGTESFILVLTDDGTPTPQAELSVSKTDDIDPIGEEQMLTYTIIVNNNGPDLATGVILTDTLPEDVGFESVTTSQGSCTGDDEDDEEVICDLGDLTNGANAVITIMVMPEEEGEITNTVEVTGNELDPDLANNSTSETTTVTESIFCNGVEATIIGTAGDDLLNGTSGDDVIVGLDGNDIINGKGGNDIICGRRGDDVITGGSGSDLLKGNRGADTLQGNSGADELRGGRGADILEGGNGADILKGRRGDDILDGGQGSDLLRGGRGQDTLLGGNGADELHGGRQADTLEGGSGKDTLFGGRGADWLLGQGGADELRGRQGNDVLEGGSGADELYGGQGDDSLAGNGGSDFLNGGPGTDELNGGGGTDTCTNGETNISCEG